MRNWSIATQIMLLVTLATLLASAAMVAIALNGPPARAMPHSYASIAAALRGEPSPSGRLAHLAIALAASPPRPGALDRDRTSEQRLADILASEPTTLRVWSDETAGLGGRRDALFGDFVVARMLPEGRWQVARPLPDGSVASWWRVTTLSIVGVLAVILLAAWVLARRISHPIRRLDAAAHAARAGERVAFDAHDGPPEIRRAAQALSDLHRRTLDHADQRLTMLGAIAHDLGTPLARLAFRAEALPAEARDAAQGDIAAMREMIADSLAMARPWDGPATRLDLAALCRDIAQRESEVGRTTSVEAPPVLDLRGHPTLLRRMVQNLVDNAVRYGGCARLSLATDGEEAILKVADDGPGFPDMARARLLEPYARGEPSRNRETGGSGLGLAVVAQAVERHGGSIDLGDAPGGGALVTVRLPLGES